MGRKPTVNLTLPKGMRARPKAGGRLYYYLDTGAKPRREIPLGSDFVAAVQQWASLTSPEAIPAVITFRNVAERYQRDILPTKATRTQKDNLAELAQLLAFFDNPPVPLEAIEPLHVRQYLDWRSQTAKVRANREKALLSHIWNFARDKGITSRPNPCAGIKGFSEPGRRDTYIEDEVYRAVHSAASQPLRDALDLAYLTGQRPADVLKMDATHVRDGMLRVKQNKTGAELRMRLADDTGALNALGQLLERLAAARRTSGRVSTLALIAGANGMRLGATALDSAFDRARIKAAALHPALADKIKGFQFRDLRAKAGTDKADSQGMHEAQRQLGHTSMTMTEHYVRMGKIVTPTR